jgi:hypothetical protein
MKLKHALLLATPLLTSATAYAGTFKAFDARSAAMGGTGVASAQIVSAPFYNPAMLASQRDEENFSLLVGAGVSAQDDDNLLQHLDNFANSTGTTQDNEAAAAGAANPASIQVNTFFSGGWASKNWSMALASTGSIKVDVDFEAKTPSLTSKLHLSGVQSKETGLAIATTLGGFAVGITPKSIKLDAYSTSVDATGNSDINNIVDSLTETTVASGSLFTFDVGVVYPLSDNLKVGATMQNVLEKSYSGNGKTFKVNRSTRAGIAYTGDIITLAADYDLTKSDPVISGGEQTQYMALGAEVDLLDSLQLRAGYNKNMAVSSSKPTTTLGLGFNLLVLQLDLTAMKNNDNTSVFLQLGARW